MRTLITVVGIGKRRSGTTKQNRSYDFIPVSFVMEDKDTQGHKALTVNVDGDMYVKSGMNVGDVLDVVMHDQNFRTYIDAIL